MKNCKSCEAEMALEAQFCSQCGQKVITERLTVKAAIQQIFFMLTNFERGFWNTAKQVFVAPAQLISDYINGKTKPYYHPFKFVFVLASIAVVIGLSLDLYETQQAEFQHLLGNDGERQAEINHKVMEAMRPYMNLVTLVIIPFISFVSWRLFRKKGLNYAEHLVTNAYLFGGSTMIGFITLTLLYFFPDLISVSFFMGLSASIFMLTYGYKKLFEVKWLTAFFKSLLTFILGYGAMMIASFLFGVIGVLFYILAQKLFGF